MRRLTRAAPILVIGLWCGAIANAMAFAALGTTEPPVWDALSYVLKGYAFWQAVGAGKLFNPFALPMTVRPPGTILMSYPFGWSDNFHWFYFRSCFIPIALLISAVYIAGWSRRLTRPGHWVLAGLTLGLVGMPIFYQFQRNDFLPAAVSWGMVDGFLAGVCAIAAAAVVRGIAERSIAWSALAAMAAGLSLWIKPSGLALMALVGLAWLILLGSSLGWRFAELWRDAALRRFATRSFAMAFVTFGIAVGLAVLSPYFSAENIAFGTRVLTILQSEFVTPMTLDFAEDLVRISFGYVMPIVVLFGLLVAARSRADFGSAIAALVCIIVGAWLWLVETEANQIRYFLPFGVMAFVFLLPPLLTWLQNLKPVFAYGCAGTIIVPTLIITALLLTPDPSDRWQRIMGISLHVNDYRVENEQAANFLNQMKAEGKDRATVYLTDTTSLLRNLVAVWDNSNVTNLPAPRVAVVLPLDWQRTTTIRVQDISDVIAAEFVRDEARRKAILAQRQVADFASLVRLFNAWVSGLSEVDGISVISEARVRLVRIVDRAQFESALARMEADHDMPQAYYDANPPRWWSGDELASRNPRPSMTGNIGFHAATDTYAALRVRGAEVTTEGGGVQASFWLESGAGAALGDGWYLFAHLVDAAGKIVGNAQVEWLPSPFPEKPIHHYSLSYPVRPKKALAVAFGVFKPHGRDAEFLQVDQDALEWKSDWENRRLIVPLPASH